ncbi:hypothetical protein CEXT_558431 [Caerostris extrusa]|uniref:STAS domain-containing protein n=1 Tax=Caerostris extrusa TaxID=172846 RepID=A0AAV4TNJ4_CAEEX|nr:hypothetical protein CEXT_558431 [Caerostris extrusa]
MPVRIPLVSSRNFEIAYNNVKKDIIGELVKVTETDYLCVDGRSVFFHGRSVSSMNSAGMKKFLNLCDDRNRIRLVMLGMTEFC